MKTASVLVILSAILVGMGAFSPAFASSGGGGGGNYPSRDFPVDSSRDLRPPVDRAKYSLGKNVFDGRVSTLGAVKPEEQKSQLQFLQSRLPKRAAKKKDLVALAGNLSTAQFAALAYYVEQRYHSR